MTLSVSISLNAQTERLLKIIISPNHDDWIYNKGENAKFEVTIFKNNVPLKNVKIYYETGLERMTPVKKDSMILALGTTIIDGGTLKQPGFLRCTVTATFEGVVYRGLATAGFEPYAIQPYAIMPTDFLQFWDNSKVELSKIPIDAKMILLPERCTENTNV